ncbi:AraC family transcriptional regulator [Trebonia kvetii]|uniref:AraC family transcriptional regulator n=1 Tax=Trebonia kvetii TaxID=2480626 RepID=A0A6P2BZB0_9ACTN|nr:AraC family transcriptional regulator [Trebonia kvetii]TVZ03546.1 AraC family transcriptional regulator [Trebonia kvetii]
MVRWDVERSPMSVQLLLRLGADYGLTERLCLESTGLAEENLRDAGATVSARQELTVIENLLRALGDPPGLGLDAGIRYHLTTYGIWGFAMISSPTWRSAIDIGLRYLDLTFAFTHIKARDRGEEFHLVLDAPDIPLALQRFVIERDSAAIQTIQHELFATPIHVRGISYPFPAPASGAERYSGIFGVMPVFGAPECAVAIPAEILDLPLPQGNEHTTAIAREQCRQLLASRHARTGVAGRVRDYLLARTAAPPDAEQVAAALHMSERTLRRRLAGEGVTLRGLLDEIREQLAEEFLVTGRMPVAEVAQRLGYVEVSSFSQAFRRWKSVGPREFRASHLARHRSPAA